MGIHWGQKIRATRFPLSFFAAIALAVLFIGIGYTSVDSLQINIGGVDDRFINRVQVDDLSVGFHQREDFGGTMVRWSSASALLKLPRTADGLPDQLALRLINGRPVDLPDPQVTIFLDGQEVVSFAVAQAIDGVRTYHLLIPPNTRLDWATRLELTSDTIELADDPRPLGVAVDRAQLTPLGPLWPSLYLLLCAATIGALGYLLSRMFGAQSWGALTLTVLFAATIGYGIAMHPLEVLPFVQRFVMLLALVILGIALARFFTHGDEFPGAYTRPWPVRWLAPVRVRGADLPIYLAVVWWLGPIYQLLMTADGARNVTPAPATMWVGAALIAALALLTVWWIFARRSPAEVTESVVRAYNLRLKHVALAIVTVAALVHLITMVQFAFTRSGPDFWILFRGARDWAQGGSLYNLADVAANHFGHVFKVPPFYGMLFLPFVFADGLQILFFHRLLNVLLLAITALAWFRMWGLRPLSLIGGGTLILLNFRPLADTIAFGQIDLALLCILTLALWAMREQRDILAGVLIALGTLFKIYPLMLLAFFVVRWRWRGVLGFVLGMLIFNGIAVAVIGVEMHRIYLFEVVPQISGTTAWVENQTIAGFMARFFDTPKVADIFDNQAVVLLTNLIALVLISLVCALAMRPSGPKSTTFGLQYSQFMLLMVLVVPAAWMHYETLLFIPFALLLLRWRDRDVSLLRMSMLRPHSA
ncbi:MAG: DUF2029 domain-containing protein [Oscillochloris sp.]|nr:DUF2029 domain-containing protein [Oscillochloris sp.]